ncbi:Hypothetical predicted protein [Pelobates cultripes]|uniref:Uncharacterized protein n=1 Tax=Pelobates cultripes TaxID=61616 RepID=A0AAD1RF29_PELCU|nr:Hypothetical predicted protein [Pelobates cultripes]
MADSVQPHGQTKNVPPSPAGTTRWKYGLAAHKPTTYPKLRETPTSSCMSVDKERESRKFSPDASGTHTMQPYCTSTHRLQPPRSFNLERLLQSRRTRKHRRKRHTGFHASTYAAFKESTQPTSRRSRPTGVSTATKEACRVFSTGSPETLYAQFKG